MLYEENLDIFILKNDILLENFDNFLEEFGHVNFFNQLTILFFDTIKLEKKHSFKKTNIDDSFVYLAHNVKEMLVKHFDIISISQLYYSILLSDEIDYNFKKYKDFLIGIFNLYKKLENKKSNENARQLNLKIKILKTYMDIVPIMLNKPKSILSTKNQKQLDYFYDKCNKIMLCVVSFFLNKSVPVYYVDKNEICVPHLKENINDELIKFFKMHHRPCIDTNFTFMVIDENQLNINAYFLNKKIITTTQKNTISMVVDSDVLLENKKFFGKYYEYIFPEYTLWL